ncbi:DNA cytosine methyltransferase [Stutzerimonas kunmingensis]|uniref:DNA cytosine methyltransferase n=1 Tax=Stutzerimonas kunmingensis TaxID=1211807 RepID=UPI00241DE54F|nr:DNA cytosine methyltransferase [Stutzerimonas kunmingensis]
MPTLLDLFSGCGGLALGSKYAGFSTELAVDIDPILSSSFSINFPNVPFLREDVQELSASRLKSLLPSGVDGVIGGPPCQPFSGIGRGVLDDPRRNLLGHFFRIVKAVRPRFFMMENVPGLMFPNHRPLLDAELSSLGKTWHVIGPVILDASDFGAPTKRKRVFVFGFDRKKMAVPTLEKLIESQRARTCVRDAIYDLAASVQLSDDLWRYGDEICTSHYARRLRSDRGVFCGHQRTVHKPETILRYATIPQGAVDPVGKHKRLAWDGLCPTLRAGTGSDRGSYQAVRPLHPEENRVITPREAARLQGFPDGFIFHNTVWHSFRMIGNSVSPVIAEALLANIMPYLCEPRHTRQSKAAAVA